MCVKGGVCRPGASMGGWVGGWGQARGQHGCVCVWGGGGARGQHVGVGRGGAGQGPAWVCGGIKG